MSAESKEKVREALKKLDESKAKEPTVEDLKAQVEQLQMENQQLKTRVLALGQAVTKGDQLIRYTVEKFMDTEIAVAHEQAMRQQAAMRMQGTPKE